MSGSLLGWYTCGAGSVEFKEDDTHTHTTILLFPPWSSLFLFLTSLFVSSIKYQMMPVAIYQPSKVIKPKNGEKKLLAPCYVLHATCYMSMKQYNHRLARNNELTV